MSRAIPRRSSPTSAGNTPACSSRARDWLRSIPLLERCSINIAGARQAASVNAATPIVAGDRIFLSSSYSTGAVLLQVANNTVKPIWSGDESMSNHYSTSVLKDGYLYGFDGRQEFGQTLRCVELATGKVMWNVDGFGAGTLLIAGDTLVITRESGELALAAATPKAFRFNARAQLIKGVVRAYPALANGRYYIRNDRQLAAFDLRPAG